MSRSYLRPTGWGNPIQKWLFPRFVTWDHVPFAAPILLQKQDDIWEVCLKEKAWLGRGWQASPPHAPAWPNLSFKYSPTSSICHCQKQWAPVVPLILAADKQFISSYVLTPWLEQGDQANNYPSDTPINSSQQTLIWSLAMSQTRN